MQCCEKETAQWGRVLWLTSGTAEIGVALEFGLRVVHISCPGMENLCYEQPADLSDGFSTPGGWRLYGGHRLWLAPESDDSYFPDNAPVAYTSEPNGILMEQPDPWLGIRKQLRITMTPAGVDVENIIINDSDHPIQGSSWGISTLAAGGTAVINIGNANPGGYGPQRVVSLWSGTSLHDQRVRFTKDTLTAVHKPTRDYFKIGLYCDPGKAIYENKGQRLTLTFGAEGLHNHPDCGCNFELFMSASFMELETLGTNHCLQPGEAMSHAETWLLSKL